MSKILTAEEKLKANFFNGSFIEIHSGDLKDIENIMIEFTKLHVIAALEEASKTTKWKEQITMQGLQITIIKSSILNAYPLENIK